MRDASWRELAAAGNRRRAEGPGNCGEGGGGPVSLRCPRLAGAALRDGAGARPASLAQPRGSPRPRPTCGGTRARQSRGAAAHGEREQAGQGLRPGRVRTESAGLWRPRPRRAVGAGRSRAAPARPGPRLRAGQSGGAARWVLGAGPQAGGTSKAPSPALLLGGASVSWG